MLFPLFQNLKHAFTIISKSWKNGSFEVRIQVLKKWLLNNVSNFLILIFFNFHFSGKMVEIVLTVLPNHPRHPWEHRTPTTTQDHIMLHGPHKWWLWGTIHHRALQSRLILIFQPNYPPHLLSSTPPSNSVAFFVNFKKNYISKNIFLLLFFKIHLNNLMRISNIE